MLLARETRVTKINEKAKKVFLPIMVNFYLMISLPVFFSLHNKASVHFISICVLKKTDFLS